MAQLTLDQAQTIIATALRHGADHKFQPLAVAVLDARGVPKAFAAQDGTSLRRYEIATGKAHGALSFGIGSRAPADVPRPPRMASAAVTHAVGGSLVPVPGGVLIRATDREIIGAVGISGDNSDNDEAAAASGHHRCGPDGGSRRRLNGSRV